MPALTHDELAELTGYRQSGRQREALDRMGIRYVCRPRDGRIIVRPEFLLAWAQGEHVEQRDEELRL